MPSRTHKRSRAAATRHSHAVKRTHSRPFNTMQRLFERTIIDAVNRRDYAYLRAHFTRETIESVLSRHQDHITSAGTVRRPD